VARRGGPHPRVGPRAQGGNYLRGREGIEITLWLSAGGKIKEPLKKAPWGDTFGMFTDKLGVEWLVNISGKKE
jgi:hypothetical protein